MMLSFPSDEEEKSLVYGYIRENIGDRRNQCPTHLKEVFMKFYQQEMHLCLSSSKDYKCKDVIVERKGIVLSCGIACCNDDDINKFCMSIIFKKIPQNIKSKIDERDNCAVYDVHYKCIAYIPQLNDWFYFVGNNIKADGHKPFCWSIPAEQIAEYHEVECIVSFDIIQIIYNNGKTHYNSSKLNVNAKLTWNLTAAKLCKKVKYIAANHDRRAISTVITGPVCAGKAWWIGIDPSKGREKLYVGLLQRPGDISGICIHLRFRLYYNDDEIDEKEYYLQRYGGINSEDVIKNGIVKSFGNCFIEKRMPAEIETEIKVTWLSSFLHGTLLHAFWIDYMNLNDEQDDKFIEDSQKCEVCLERYGMLCGHCMVSFICGSAYCGIIHVVQCPNNLKLAKVSPKHQIEHGRI